MRNDIRSLGAVVIELMEPETYFLDPHSIELKKRREIEGWFWDPRLSGRNSGQFSAAAADLEFPS